MERAVYPGTFDPITNGHLDIIERAGRFVDELIIAVCVNPNKEPLFKIKERATMVKENVDLDNVKVKICRGLLIDFLKEENSKLIIRGLRAISDFEDEFQMALMNKKLDSEIETIMLVSKPKYNYLSSSLMKEISEFDGCVKGLVPENVRKKLHDKQINQRGNSNGDREHN